MGKLCGETTDPDAGRGGFAEMDCFSCGVERHGFVVLAFIDADFGSWTQMQSIQKFQELAILFVNTNNFGFVFGTQIGEQDSSLFAKLCDAAANGNAVRATGLVAETF